jgi:hypothetical protein
MNQTEQIPNTKSNRWYAKKKYWKLKNAVKEESNVNNVNNVQKEKRRWEEYDVSVYNESNRQKKQRSLGEKFRRDTGEQHAPFNLFGASDVMRDATETLGVVRSELTSVGAEARDTMQVMKAGIKLVTDGFTAAQEALKKTLDSLIPLKGSVDIAGKLLNLFKTICVVSWSEKRHRWKTLMLEIAFTWGSDIVTLIVDAVSKYLADCDVFVVYDKTAEKVHGVEDIGIQHGGFDDIFQDLTGSMKNLAHSSALPAVLGSILATLTVASMGLPTGDIDKCLRFFGDRCRNMTNISNFFKSAGPFFEMVSDWVLSVFRGPLVDEKLDEILDGYEDWAREVMENIHTKPDGETMLDRLKKDVNAVFQVDRLYKRGAEFTQVLNENRVTMEFRAQLMTLMKVVEAWKKNSDTTGVFGNKPRAPPLVVYLYGESGVGKSGATWPLAIDFNQSVSGCDASDFAKEIYYRNAEQEFWDGYTGQNVCVWDDLGQKTDTAAAPNVEFLEVIRASNIAPFPLHMAQLEEKKRSKFCSKFMLLTANMSPPAMARQVKSLTYKDAWLKRIQVSAEVQVKEEFALTTQNSNGQMVYRLDPSKCEGSFDTKAYRFVIHDSFSGDVVVENGTPLALDYDQFVSYCLKIAGRNFARGKICVEELLERVSEARTAELAEMLKDSGAQHMLGDEDDVECNLEELAEEIVKLAVPKKTMYVKLRENIRDAKSFFLTKVKEVATIKTALIVIGAALTGLGVWAALNVFTQNIGDSQEETEFNNSKKNAFAKKKVAKRVEKSEAKSNVTPFVEDVSEPFTLADWSMEGPVIQEGNVSGDATTRRSLSVLRESFQSGDSKTARSKTVVRESNQSGDSQTAKSKTVVREANQSGDAKTAKQPVVNREGNYSGDARTIRVTNVEHERNMELRKWDIVEDSGDMQAWKDKTAQELISYRVLTNLFRISRLRGTTEMLLVNGLFIRDRIMLTVDHIIDCFQSGDLVRISNIEGATYTIPFDDCQVEKIISLAGVWKDAVLIQFPKHVGSRSDLVKHFQTNEDLNYVTGTLCAVTLRILQKNIHAMIMGGTKFASQDLLLHMADKDVQYRDVLQYKLETTHGDCGAPLILQDSRCLRKIAGIHVAGSSDGARMYGQSITRADLERTLSRFCGVIIRDDDTIFSQHCGNEVLPLDVLCSQEDVRKVLKTPAPTFGHIGRGEILFTPSTTDIAPSAIQGKVSPVITAPAVLYNPQVNLLNKNLEKCAMNTPYISKHRIDKAVLDVKQILFAGTSNQKRRVLTIEEALAGSDVSEHTGPINRSSSPGFPWVLFRKPGAKGKTGWLGDSDEYVLDPLVVRAVEQRLEKARRGERAMTIWTDTLKDERRPIEKVKALKTRVFGSGPMDYTIAFRMYFLSFMAHVMDTRIDNEQSIGTNVYSYDWLQTVKKLTKYGDKVIAGDFSTFDGTLNIGIMWPLVDVINEWYDDGEENALIRQVLFMEVVNSIHLCNGGFYSMDHSQPSGNPITTILNSFYNSVSMRIVFDICKERASLERSTDIKFNDVVSMVSYGDDNVLNIHDSVIAWFNQNTITAGYAVIGMIYTDETKSDGAMRDYRGIEEVAYLKRGFKKRGAKWLAPLDLSVILETCNWIRRAPDEDEACLVNCSNSIMELSMHPEDVFNMYVRQINAACLDAFGKLPPQETFTQYSESRLMEYGV